jgi:hypothetical protein
VKFMESLCEIIHTRRYEFLGARFFCPATGVT